jgi:predicted DNA binding protein
MKKIIFLFVFLLLIKTTIAQIDIQLIQYDSESRNARIQVHNLGDKNYRDITLAIDDEKPQELVGLLKKKTAIVSLRIIPAGEHNITIITDKGYIFSKTLNFAKSAETVKTELEQEREARLEREEELKKIPSIPSSMPPEPQEKLPNRKKIFTVLIVSSSAILFLILLVMLILKYKKSEREKQTPIQRPVYVRPVVRQLTPRQRRMQIELIKRREKEKERKRRELIESLRRRK